MQITTVDGHTTCPYNSNEEKQLIEQLILTDKEEININTSFKKIIIVYRGQIKFSIDGSNYKEVNRKEMFYVESEKHLKITALKETDLMFFRLQQKIQLCHCFPLDKLRFQPQEAKNETKQRFHILPVFKEIYASFFILRKCIKTNLGCKYYYNLKTEELLFIIGKAYTIEQLSLFFKESISGDISFSEEVRANIFKYRTVDELAKAMNYTISGFEKRFKKVFNTTPHRWIREKKADKIYYDLTMTDLSLTQIADKYDFKTNNYFVAFCKSYFGRTPGHIRRNRGIVNSEQ